MTKAPVKRKQKQKQKQKVIQKTKVSQNVKIVIGDVKRKQVRRKTTGSKAGAKPNIVLNVSAPQLNNPYMQYFKEQMMNQQPVQGTTLKQNELLNEREENKASRVGALHKLDQEPADVARVNRAQAAEGRIREAKVKQELERRKQELQSSINKQPSQQQELSKSIIEMQRNLKPVARRVISPTPLRPRMSTQQEQLMAQIRDEPVTLRKYAEQEEEEEDDEDENQQSMLSAIEEQQQQTTKAIEEAGAGAGAGAGSVPSTPIRPAKQVELPSTVVQGYDKNPTKVGRPLGSKNKTAEEKLAEERAKENQPKRKRGRRPKK